MERARILVVEDEAIIAKELQSRLQQMGYDVPCVAMTGEDAIDKARAINPALILMDVILIGPIDGIETARQIRSKRDIPVIYLSAYTDEMLSERAKDTEPYGFLSKPVSSYDLRNTIEMALYKNNTEKALKREKLFTEKAINAQIDTFFVFDPVTGKAVRWNGKFREISGYTDEEIAGLKAPDSYYSPEDLKKAAAVINDVMTNGQGRVEISLVCKDGRRVQTEYLASAINDDENNLKYIIAIGRDITERKKAEERIKNAESRLRSLIEQTTDAVFCFDFITPVPVNLPIDEQVKLMYDCILSDCNLVCARSYGADRVEQAIGRNLTDLFGTVPGNLDKLFSKLIEKGYRIEDGEGVEKLPDGTERFYLNNGYGVIENGKLLRVWGTFRDITERKKSEKELLEEQNKARNYLDIAGVMIVAIDYNQNVTLINRKGCEILGYSQDEIAGKNWFDVFIPGRFRNTVKNVFDNVIAGEMESAEYFENPVLTKSGEERIIAWHNTVLKDTEGRIIGTLSSGEDVTDRKQNDRALQESEGKFRYLFESQPTYCYLVSMDGVILDVNKTSLKMLGYEKEELVGRPILSVYAPDFQPHMDKLLIKWNTTGKLKDEEAVIVTKQGERRLVLLSSDSVRDRSGNILYSIFVQVDITERKRAEEEINTRVKELEKYYEIAVGREIKMKELKELIKQLKSDLLMYKDNIDK